MAEFGGYVCWSKTDIDDVLAPVVEAASEAAFLATHQSLPIIPDRSKHVGHRDTVREPEVLEEFTTFDRDPSIMAIVGPPGSGKSHLIKWLYANLKTRQGSLVLYVPREDTSLQVVLKRVLKSLPGEEARALYDDISKATDKWSQQPALAIANVVSMITNQLEYAPPSVDDAETVLQQLLTGWSDGDSAGPPILSRWLRTEAVSKKLLADDGIIARNVRTALSHYVPDDGKTPEFTPDDLLSLPLVPGLGREAENVLRRLTSDSDQGDKWRGLAARMLNDCLDEAIGSLVGLTSSTSLVDVMSMARQMLKRDNRDLVFLIEDFALFDRIGQPLIDALVTPRGDDRCRLRTAFAITDDPYERLGETLRSRVGCLYKTGVAFDAGRGETETMIDFVGRYLNSARVGTVGLNNALARTDTKDVAAGDWVPNACSPCEFRAECHSSAGFGATSDEYGLYPLNRIAIKRLVTAALADGKFVPRTLLADVLVPLLTSDAEALEDGKFPTGAFETRADRLPNGHTILPIIAEVVKQLQDEHDIHRDRRVRSLRFWLDGFPTRPVDLGQPIHEAFKLPVIGVEVGDIDEEVGSELPPPPSSQKTAPELTEIDRWAADVDTGLLTATTAKLQQALFDLLIGHINWNDHLISPSNKDVQENGIIVARESFDIERGAGARNPKPGALRWSIPANADSAVLLKSVLRLSDNDYFTSGRDYVLVQAQIARWSADLLRACATYTEVDFPLEAAVECLITCAWLTGAPREAYVDPVAAVVAAVATMQTGPPVGAKPEWSQLVGAMTTPDPANLRKRFLDWTQAAQGDGDPLGFDLVRWLPVARHFLDTVDFQSVPSTAPAELKQLRGQFARNLSTAIRAEADVLLHIDDHLDWDAVRNQDQVADALLAAVNDASNRGVFEPGERRGKFTLDCKDFAAQDLQSLELLTEYKEILQGEFCPMQIYAVVHCLRVAPLAWDVLGFLDDANKNLDLSIAAATREIKRQYSDETPEQAEAKLAGILSQLTDTVQTIKMWRDA